MGALEQVTQMRREGKTDEEIISNLKNQRVSPKEINDALNHAQIKNAVSDIRGDDGDIPMPQSPGDQQYPDQNYSNYNQAAPQEQQSYGDQDQVYNPQPQEYYPQQNYQSYGDAYSQTNTDTIVEVSEQVFDEKISNVMKKVDSMDEFKSLTQARLDHLDERLKRIEVVIDRLQSAILEKVGSYGNNLESIKKEMSMMQDSFSKTLGSMVDLSKNKTPRQTQPEESEEEPESKEKNSKKKK
ncbi:MAG: hypothetical protein WAU65_01180 [Candidatus Nanoarchaeia archaeon]